MPVIITLKMTTNTFSLNMISYHRSIVNVMKLCNLYGFIPSGCLNKRNTVNNIKADTEMRDSIGGGGEAED